MLRRLFTGITLVLAGLTLVSTQNADITIIEGGERPLGSLNPVTCINDRCVRVTDLMFPKLLNLDSQTGWLIPADEANSLVQSWEIEGNAVTYKLRKDKFWSDGTPITAHDVFFSYWFSNYNYDGRYWSLLNDHISAAAPIDKHTIQFSFNDATCDALLRTNFPVIPAHAYDVHFAETVGYAGEEITQWFHDVKLPDTLIVLSNSEYANPTVTSDAYQLLEPHSDEAVRLFSTDGHINYTNLHVGVQNTVDHFLSGDTNLIVEPPYDQRAILDEDPTSKAYTYPGHLSFFIALNLADPNNPQPAFDEDGNLITQIPHPILSDIAVRQAMQMALDVDTMIETMLDGYGVPLASLLPPSALGFNPSLEPAGYDPTAAQQILSDAGWHDTDNDGIRECISCFTAAPGTQLVITMDYYETDFNPSILDNAVIAQSVREQFQAVGIGLKTETVTAYNELYQQTFEAFLVDGRAASEGTTWLTDMFRQKYDNPKDSDFGETDLNHISYHNDEVDRLLDEADYKPNCDVETRRLLYQQVDAILHADQAALWLFSPNRMIFSRQPFDLPADFLKTFLPVRPFGG